MPSFTVSFIFLTKQPNFDITNIAEGRATHQALNNDMEWSLVSKITSVSVLSH